MKGTILLVALLFSGLAQASSLQKEFDRLMREAGGSVSLARGEQLFRARQPGAENASCTTCHGQDARQSGRHVRTNKEIAPLAPIANAERFTETAKVEKWFKRNCQEVLGRLCTPQEKADFAAYMISLR